MLRTILTVLQIFSCVSIAGLVLLQRGKGADAGAGFGAGASGTVFGARGATTGLSRATAIFAAIFMINSLALAYMGTRKAPEQKTILDTLTVPPAPAPAAPLSAPAATTPPSTGNVPAPPPGAN
ncbi:MAG: preprotein translocase subunit SecG [Steroidobacteraceae bacterium]